MTKVILQLLFLALILPACKKEKFDIGLYSVSIDGAYENNVGKKIDYSHESFVTIISETDNELIVESYNPSSNSIAFTLIKKGRKIEGNLPVSINTNTYFTIKANRNLYNSSVSGKFETSIGVTVDGYFQYVPMSGKFKMKKY